MTSPSLQRAPERHGPASGASDSGAVRFQRRGQFGRHGPRPKRDIAAAQLPSQFVAPQVLDADDFYLEGEALKVIHLGHTDTAHSTGLHLPSIGLVISGDCVYNNTHLYLAECDEKARNAWLRALDRIESLHPKQVVAGHGVLDPDSSPRHIGETRRYLSDFNACVATTSTQLELYERMLELHPNRVNPGSLWAAAKAAKPS